MSGFDRTAEYALHHSEEEGAKDRKQTWIVFWILLGVTTVEVSLGLIWKSWGLNWEFVKWTFIIMTLVKGYYIVADYMHLKHEVKFFKYLMSIPFLALGIYFVILILNEGIYLYEDADKLLMIMW